MKWIPEPQKHSEIISWACGGSNISELVYIFYQIINKQNSFITKFKVHTTLLIDKRITCSSFPLYGAIANIFGYFAMTGTFDRLFVDTSQ